MGGVVTVKSQSPDAGIHPASVIVVLYRFSTLSWGMVDKIKRYVMDQNMLSVALLIIQNRVVT